MNLETFLLLLPIISVLTSLFTEGAKKLLDSVGKSYATNLVVLFMAITIGGVGMITYYVLAEVAWTLASVWYILLMIGFNWLCAMVGYDKVMQAIMQMKNK